MPKIGFLLLCIGSVVRRFLRGLIQQVQLQKKPSISECGSIWRFGQKPERLRRCGEILLFLYTSLLSFIMVSRTTGSPIDLPCLDQFML